MKLKWLKNSVITFIKGMSVKAWISIAIVAVVAITGVVVGVNVLGHKHVYGEWTTLQEATCTRGGRQIRTCECGEEEEEIIPAAGHTGGDWVVDVEPTCVKTGSKSQRCAICSVAIRNASIEKIDHTYGEWIQTIAPTCTDDGENKKVCTVCEHIETVIIPASGHVYGDWIQTVVPNCTDDGENKKVCTICSHEETEVVPASGHNYVDYICSVCQTVATEKAVQTVKIANTSLLLPLNTPVKLDVQVYPTDALYTSITYTIDERNNSCGATITEDGVLSCTQLGSVRIRVTIDNVSSAYVTFNVPTEIRTAEEFDAIRNNLKGYYILCNDIDLSAYSTWTPIGYATKAADGSLSYSGTGFQGEFNGNGYTVSGVNIDLAQTNLITVGLFGFVDTSAVVSNVKVEANIAGSATTSEYIGTLTGVNYGVVNNCEIISTINMNGALYIGGVVGQNNGNLTDCTADISIKASNSNSNGYYVGGIAGQFVIGNMADNTAKANIEITSCNFCYVGGITGNAYGAFNGTNCDVTITVSANSSVTSYVGGVVGKIEDSDREIVIDLNNTTITGSITITRANALYVGGIAGYGDAFDNCINEVDITTSRSTTTYVGGIAGYGGVFNNCINNAAITTTNSSTTYVAGIAGDGDVFNNCINNAAITTTNSSTTYVAGIAGDSTKISNSKNNGVISVNSTSTVYAGGIAGNTETLNDVTNYTDISVTASSAYFGGVAGKAVSAKNVYNYCYSLTSNSTGSFGGVIGECNQTLENAYNTASLNAKKADSLLYVGGIVGRADAAGNTIKDVTNSGKINVDVPKLGVAYIGGIAGKAVSILNAKNSSTVISVSTNSVTVIYNSEHLNVGGVSGYSSGSIENSYSYASITLENSASYAPNGYYAVVGGLAGTAKNVSRSYATGDIFVSLYNSSVNAGGLVGNLNGTASDSYARGSVTGVTTSEIKIGGLVAYAQSGAYVQNCYAAYNYLTTNITSNGSIAYVGGLIAHNLGTVTDSYAMNYINTIGSGSSDTIYVGGVIGYNNGTVSKSYSLSATEHVLNTDISVDIDCTSNLSANVYVGGFVGYNNKTITNCYASAAVIGRGCYTGGFVGYQSTSGRISYALALAPVNSGISGQTHTGGFSGNDAGSYASCIFSTTGTQISADNGAGGATVSGIVGKSETELLNTSTLSGFDTSIWTIASGSIPTLTLNGNWKVYNDGYDNFNVLKSVVNPDRQYVKVSSYTAEIKFESNWDLTLPETVVLEKESNIVMLPTLAAEGYFFVGWFTDAEFAKAFTVDEIYEVTADMTLYAYFRKIIDVPASETYVFNAEDITFDELDFTGEYYAVEGTPVAKEAGEYSVTLILTKNYCWQDGNTENKSVVWKIDIKPVTVPTDGNYSVTGNAITLRGLDTSDVFYTITGITSAKAVGDYSCTLTLVDKINSKWADGTTEDKTINWSIVNGVCGDDIGWQLYENGTLALKGSGEMYNYDSEKAPWYAQSKNIKTVTISADITSIGTYAFQDCTSLISITIPENVTSIGGFAFSGCSSLESITLPFVGGSVKTESDTYQYPFGYIFGTSSYTGGVETKQKYYGSSTTSTTSSTYYIPASLKSVTITGGNILYGAFRNCSSLTSITIPDSVASIGDYAFYQCSGLTSITIPDSVASIGNSAFYQCSGLTSITIGNSVTSIGNSAFHHCSGLTSIMVQEGNPKYHSVANCLIETKSKKMILGCKNSAIPADDSVTSIGDYAFYECSGLTTITIPDSVTSIGQYAFYQCSGLTTITIPDSVTSIGQYAFYECSGLTTITIPDSVTSIGQYAFYQCSGLTSITIGNGVTSISEYAFRGCSGLTNITIPEGVTSIGYYAFGGCSGLTNITISEGVTKIGTYAFYGCSGLTNITISESVTSIGNSAFGGCSSLESITLPFVGATKDGTSNTHFGYIFGAGSYVYNSSNVPASLKNVVITGGTTIANCAFQDCSGLTSITIPDSVTSIGKSAFGGCSSLESITLPFVGGSVKTANDSHQYPFGYVFGTNSYKGSIETKQNYYAVAHSGGVTYSTYYIPASLKSVTITGGNILYGAFRNCSSLTSITIPDSVASIGDYAFYQCSGLTSITIPDSVASIGEFAFDQCSGLTSITIPDSVTSIGNSAFGGCSSLESITLPFVGATKDGTSHTHSGYIFGSYNSARVPASLKNIVITGGTSIGSSAFRGCSGLTSITIPDSVTSIGNDAFHGCSGLTSITIPEGVTSIGSDAFRGCSSLTSVTIGDSVTSIGTYAFEGCSSLTSITIPDNVTSIGNYAFSGCNSLTSITIGDSVKSIGSYAFSGCNSLTSITIGDSVTSIGDDAFYNCDSLTSITIPDSVTSIGSSAFRGCSSLTSITIPDSVTSIGSSAFRGCSSLTSITIPDSVTSIGDYAFDYCSSLEAVYITDLAAWCNISFNNSSSNPLYYANNLYLDGELVTELVIPNCVTSIGNYAFYNCDSLTSITIPDSVTSIGSYAFYGCDKLVEVINKSSLNITAGSSNYGYVAYYAKEVHGDTTKIVNQNDYLFYTYGGVNYLIGYVGTNTELILPESYNGQNYEIYKYAFYGCSSLTSITIGNGVTSIGDDAFAYCSSLTSITIPDSVTSIGDDAFYDCDNLTSITIPDSVTSIGSYAFRNCSRLSTITFEGTIAQWNAISKGSDWNYPTGKYTIYCTDGEIAKDGTVTLN